MAKIFLSILVLLILFTSIVNAEGQENIAEDIGSKKPGNSKLEHMLDKMAVNAVHSKLLAKEYNIKDNSVQVIIDLKKFSPQYLEELENAGAIIEVSDKNLVQAQVPVSRLNAIANLSFVNHIRKPEKYTPFAISEGVAAINATPLHSLDYNGSGVKIAVLDLGFAGYQSKLGTELPSSVVVRSFRADRDITGEGGDHGTAVAEIVHDIAPGAMLYLVNFATDLEENSAVNWFISQNVDIISVSAGKSIGPKDGTDYADNIVNKATAADILWVNAAGNEADEHWMGYFYDPENNKFHNFANDDETQDIYAEAGSTIDVRLDWDDWPYSNQDYDLGLYDSSLRLLDSSANFQNGTQPPFEEILLTAPYTGIYKIAIKKYSATMNVKFHLYSPGNPTMQYIVSSGSLSIPGASTGSLTVGATHWSNDALEPYSSQGPTDDGRIKPDVVAPDDTASSVYGTFQGTSASTPHVSGAAALLLQMNPGLSVSQLKQALENGAKDLGASGKDNLYGSGRIDVYKSAQWMGIATTFTLSNGSISLPDSMGRRNTTITVQLKDSTGNNIRQASGVIFTVSNGILSASGRTTNASTGQLNVTLSGSTSLGSVSPVVTAYIAGMSPDSVSLTVDISQPALESVANVSNVTVNVSTPVLFTVTTGNTKVQGAEVILSGAGVSTTGTTDSNGDVTINVNATGTGIISVTTSRSGYAGEVTSINANYGASVLTTINIILGMPTVASGSTRTFTALGLDQYGNNMDITPSVFWSSNTTVGIINSTTGVFGAYRVGTTSITARNGSAGTISGTATVNVTTGPLANIAVLPEAPTFQVNATQQFTATGADAAGNDIAITASWNSSNLTVGTINATTGMFTALTSGTTLVNVTAQNITGSTPVIVQVITPVNGTITGKVTNATLEPIPDVVLTVGGTTATPNPTGTYTISIVPGNYTLTATASGYIPQSANITVVSAQIFTWNFTLQSPIASSGSINRTISPSSIPPSSTLTITLTPSPSTLFDIPGYQVIETIPFGFTFVSTSVASATNQGNVYTFTRIGGAPITYTLTAPPTNGSYTISGTFKDELTNTGAISGATTIRVGGMNYDSNGDGIIARSEAVQAVMEYFSGVITRQQAIEIVIAFFTG